MKGVKRPIYFIEDLKDDEKQCMKMIPLCEKVVIIRRLIDDLNVFYQSYSSSNLLTTTTVTFHSKHTDDDHVVRLVRDVETRQHHFELHSHWQSAVDRADPSCSILLIILSRGLVTFRLPGMKRNQRHSPIKMKYAGICYTLYYRLCTRCDRFIFFCAPSDIRSNTYKPNTEFEHIKEHVLSMENCAHDLILNEEPFDQLFVTTDVCPRPAKKACIEEVIPHNARCPMGSDAAPRPMDCMLPLENDIDVVPPRVRYVQNTDVGMVIERITIIKTENAPVNDTETIFASEFDDNGGFLDDGYSIMDDCELFNGEDILYGTNMDAFAFMDENEYQRESYEASLVKPFPFLSCK